MPSHAPAPSFPAPPAESSTDATAAAAPPSEARAPSVAAAAPLESSTDSRALASFLLGFFAVLGTVFGMGLPLGVPAILFGAVAHRDIERSGGRRTGRGLATAGIGLGVFGAVLFLGWAAIVIRMVVTPRVADADPPPIVPSSFSPWPAETVLAPHASAPIVGIALDRSGGALRAQLASQAAAARRSGQVALVETVAPECDACDEIAAAMRDPSVQSALSSVRLVVVDMDEFHAELGRLRMDESTAPWFYLVDGRGEPRDAVGANEWDDNDAANIAPVLHAFVRGSLHRRRHEWHGGATL